MRKWLKFPIVFLCLIGLFTLLLVLVFCIPNKAIEWHQEYSMYILRLEATWESFGNQYGLHSQPGMPDNSTDRSMMRRTIVSEPEKGPFRAAMSMNNYERYWHGYQVFLRPLLVFFQIHQLRWIGQFVFHGLLFGILLLLHRQHPLASWAFLFTMIAGHITVIPTSLQFMPSFVTLFAALLFLLLFTPKTTENLAMFFMVTGAVTNFVDFLTTPMITLGIPLLVFLFLIRDRLTLSGGLRQMFFSVLAWGLGYALCWMSKWALALLSGSQTIQASVMGKADFWLTGEDHHVDRLRAVRLNFTDFFLQQGARSWIIPLLFVLLLLLLLIRFHRPIAQCLSLVPPFLLISVSPYVWYFVLAEHSIQHHWFTYRLQIISLLGIFLLFLSCIDEHRLTESVRRIRKRNPS